jgi:hypothetical protein
MKIDVIDIVEDSDGGATVTLDMEEGSKIKLIEIGFNSLIREAINEMQQEETLNELVAEAQKNGEYNTIWWEHECIKQYGELMSFPKGVECDWCGITEETYKHNKETIERIKLYDEMRNEG